MKCPYCGGEMEQGSVSSRGWRVEWLPEGAKYPFWRWSESPGITLLPYQYFSRPESIKAPRCKTCRKIILDY